MRLALLALGLLVATGCASDPTPEAPVETAAATPQASGDAEPGNIQPGVTAPDFTLASTSGDEINLASLQGKTVVLEWLNYDCPYVQKHYASGNMQALQQSFTEADDVVWLSVVSSAPGEQGYWVDSEMDARTAQEKGKMSHVLQDASGEVGRLYGAKTTPHMFVISPEGRVVYNGAIDDKPVTNPESLNGATNYLVGAMEALDAGRDADPARTEPYGCSVKYADA